MRTELTIRARRMKRIMATQYSLYVQTNLINRMFNVMEMQTL